MLRGVFQPKAVPGAIGHVVGIMGQQDDIVGVHGQGLGDGLKQRAHRLVVLQRRTAQRREQAVLCTVGHLLGPEGDIQQVFAQRTGKCALEQRHVFLCLLLGGQRHGLVKGGDDFPVIVDIAAPHMGDIALIRPEPAAEF